MKIGKLTHLTEKRRFIIIAFLIAGLLAALLGVILGAGMAVKHLG